LAVVFLLPRGESEVVVRADAHDLGTQGLELRQRRLKGPQLLRSGSGDCRNECVDDHRTLGGQIRQLYRLAVCAVQRVVRPCLPDCQPARRADKREADQSDRHETPQQLSDSHALPPVEIWSYNGTSIRARRFQRNHLMRGNGRAGRIATTPSRRSDVRIPTPAAREAAGPRLPARHRECRSAWKESAMPLVLALVTCELNRTIGQQPSACST